MHSQFQHLNLISQYSFLITVHQTLLSLPSPVPRSGKRQQFYKSTFFDAYKRGQVRNSKLDEVGRKLQASGNLDELVYAQSRDVKSSSTSSSGFGIGSGGANRFGSSSSGSGGSTFNSSSSQNELNAIGKKPLTQKEVDRLELIGLSLGNRLSREDLAVDLLPALTKINLARKKRGESEFL